jgi:hypothetical protein
MLDHRVVMVMPMMVAPVMMVVMVSPVMMMMGPVVVVMRNRLGRRLGRSEAWRRGEADDKRGGGEYALNPRRPQLLFSS